MTDLSESIWNLALQPLETLYLHYHNAYGHQIWRGDDLPGSTPIYEITCSSDHVVLFISCSSQKESTAIN